MPGLPHRPDSSPAGGVQRPVPGGPESAAEGRGPAGPRRGDPSATRGGTGKTEGGAVMERRTFLAMVSGGLLAAPLAAEAQHEGKVWRIGWLTLGTSTSTPNYRLPFVQG